MLEKKSTKAGQWVIIRRDGHEETPPANPPANPPVNPPATPPAQVSVDAKTWQEFLDKQPEPIKKLYGEHHTSLQNSIKATRDERDAFEKQIKKIKDMLPEDQRGGELDKTLGDTLGKLATETKKATFFEAGTKPEIGCTNLTVAFMLAAAKDLYKRDGTPDWELIKAEFPEGFAKAVDPTKPPVTPVSPTDPKTPVALTKEAVEKMTPDEINKNWDAVKVFLASQEK